MNISFETDIPENQGILSKTVIEFIDACEAQDLQLNTFMLICNNKAIAQFWKKPYEKDCVQLLYSLTKSFTSVGVGIASDKQLISLEDSVISFFPDKLPETITENLKKMKVKHLLSMTCGIHENTYGMLYVLEKSKHRNGYGYQMQIGHNGSFNHPGGFGTLCYVSPYKNIVIAATSRKKNYEEIMDLIQKKFIGSPVCRQHSEMSNDYKKLIDMVKADIKIEDIAHSVSLTTRANGHFKHFYSVARHAVNCNKEAKK